MNEEYLDSNMDANNDVDDSCELVKGWNELVLLRKKKLDELREKGMDPYQVTSYKRSHYSQDIIDQFDALEGQAVKIAGRLMAIRQHGKASFVNLQDMKGRIQVYLKVDEIGEEAYKFFQEYFDIGDFMGVEGIVFRTKRGEISVKAENIKMLCKALRPLPEKWHGLKDVEIRYRQRYVDLIVNPEVRKTFEVRSKFIRYIREFLDDRGFMEVETPMLHPIAGGANARPFITYHNALDMNFYLRIAPELYLKRLTVGGFEKVYEINRNFRNEGISIKHNPEYTAMELYWAYVDYEAIMELTESLIAYAVEKSVGTTKVVYQGQELDFAPPWRRITIADAIKEHVGIDFAVVKNDEEARQVAKQLQLSPEKDATKGKIMMEIFEEKVEEKIIQPTFVSQYPVEVSPLSKRNAENPDMTDRFEAYIMGREIANAFSELNDPIDQRERFEEQVRQKEKGDEEAHMMDEDFIRALEYGLPPTGGLGIGIDRLVMFITDSYSIRDVLLFPTMRPEK
jgi:lysyl-tRNA synthetase class 2